MQRGWLPYLGREEGETHSRPRKRPKKFKLPVYGCLWVSVNGNGGWGKMLRLDSNCACVTVYTLHS